MSSHTLNGRHRLGQCQPEALEDEDGESDGDDKGPRDPIQFVQMQGLASKLIGQVLLIKICRILSAPGRRA